MKEREEKHALMKESRNAAKDAKRKEAVENLVQVKKARKIIKVKVKTKKKSKSKSEMKSELNADG